MAEYTIDELQEIASGKPPRKDYALQFFQNEGWSPEQATGIVANLIHESGGALDTKARGDNGASIGIAQWNAERRKGLGKFAYGLGTSPHDLDTQLHYINYELHGPESAAGEKLRNATSPEEATKVFSQHFERPGKPMMESRLTWAKRLWNAMTPGEAEAASVGPKKAYTTDELRQIAGSGQQGVKNTYSMDELKAIASQGQPTPSPTTATPAMTLEEAAMAGAPEAALVRPPIPTEEIPIGAKLGVIGLAERGARAIPPDWGAAAMGYAPTEPDTTTPEERATAGRYRLRQELFGGPPQHVGAELMLGAGQPKTVEDIARKNIMGTPEFKPQDILYKKIKSIYGEKLVEDPTTFEGSIFRGISSMWPDLMALYSLGRLGAPTAFALWGLTEEKPLVGAAKGFALGYGLKGINILSEKLADPVFQWTAKIAGASGLGAGAAALEGGTTEDMARQATLFAMFEVYGFPRKKVRDQLGMSDKDAKTINKSVESGELSPEALALVDVLAQRNIVPATEYRARPEEPPVGATPIPQIGTGERGIVELPKTSKQLGEELAAVRARDIESKTLTAPELPPIESSTIPEEPVVPVKLGSTTLYSGIPNPYDMAAILTPGVKAGQELLSPVAKEGRTIKEGAQKLFLPTAISPEHLKAGEILGSEIGPMHRKAEGATELLREDSRYFDKQGVHNPRIPLEENIGVKFMSDMSQGRQMDLRLTITADKVKEGFNKRLNDLDKAGAPLEKVRENYFPGIWEKESIRSFNQAIAEGIREGRIDPETFNANDATPEVKAWIKDRVNTLMQSGQGSDISALQYFSKRPFKGGESFRKEKVFDDIMTGVELGLQPYSNNPIDLVKAKYAEMDRSAMANGALRKYEANGDVIALNNSGLPMKKELRADFNPAEWKPIDDRYGTIWFKDEVTGMPVKAGTRVAKIPVADVLNNYLSSSLYNNPYFGRLYKGYMATANLLNQTQLGVGSLFHAGFTGLETQITAGAEIIKDIYGVARGNRTIGDLGKTIVDYPTAMFITAYKGSKILGDWRNRNIDVPTNIRVGDLPTEAPDKIAQITKAAELAGAGFKLEQGLRTNQTEKMVRDWYSEKYVKASLRSPIALIEQAARPIMDFLVPRQKAGVFGELVGRIMEMSPDKTMEQLTPAFRQAWNRVDARLGQVRYDRLFINNTAKNILQGSTRAPGWTGGTLGEIGGAPKDVVNFFKEWVKTGKAPENIPDRVAYTLSLVATTAIVNGLLTYVLTKEAPTGMDFWAFRDGTYDDQGRPNRLIIPTYMKDLFAWSRSVSHTATAKLNPLLSVGGEIARNRDYYGTQIYNPEGDWTDFVKEVGTHGIKQFVPFWIRGTMKVAESEGSTSRYIAPLVGVMPAPREYITSPAEKVMDKYSQKFQYTKTKEEFELGKIKKKVEDKFRSGKIDEAYDLIDEKVTEYNLDIAKVNRWIKEAHNPSIVNRFKKLPIEWQLKTMNVANQDEKEILFPTFLKKMGNLTVHEREKYQEKIDKVLNEM